MLKLIKERPQHLVMRKSRKEKKEANYQRNFLDNDTMSKNQDGAGSGTPAGITFQRADVRFCTKIFQGRTKISGKAFC